MPEEEEDPNIYEGGDEDDDSEEEDEDEEVAAQFETRRSRRIEDEEDDIDEDDDEEEDLNSPSASSSSSDENPKIPIPASNPNPKIPTAATATSSVAPAPPQNGTVSDPPPPPPSSIAAAAEAAAAAAAAAAADGDGDSSPDRKRFCTEEKKMMLTVNPADDSRRLFQRLWTDEDEIELLQGFLDFIQQRGGGGGAYHHDTGPFYDQIKTRLQLDFNKSQLVEKLRRLKKKYRNIMNKLGSGKDFSFKRAHDQATFEISRKIWSSDGAAASAAIGDDEDGNGVVNNTTDQSDKKGSRSRRRSRKRSAPEAAGVAEDHVPTYAPPPLSTVAPLPPAPAAPAPVAPSPLPNVIEDTVRSCLSPLFKELLNCAINGPCNSALGGVALNPLPLNFAGGSLNISNSEAVDDRWRKQQILELEVYSKRLELVQEQIKLALEDLRSAGS